jgi:CBS domain containing-hemolysin-like protein
MTPATTALFHGIAITAAFTVMTYFHVVLGEVVPKNVALASADKLAVLVAPIIIVFSRLAGPLVTTIERSANFISARLGVTGEAHLYHRAYWHEGNMYYKGKLVIDNTAPAEAQA